MTLEEELQEQENLQTALQKQNWYTPIEATEDITDAVRAWLKSKFRVENAPKSAFELLKELIKELE